MPDTIPDNPAPSISPPRDDLRAQLDDVSKMLRQVLANQEMVAELFSGNQEENRVRMGNYERELAAFRERLRRLEQLDCIPRNEFAELLARVEALAELVEPDGK